MILHTAHVGRTVLMDLDLPEMGPPSPNVLKCLDPRPELHTPRGTPMRSVE